MGTTQQANDYGCRSYAGIADAYHEFASDRYVMPAQDLVELVGMNAGQHALDIGCGTGVAIPFIRRAVGHHGRIIAIDPSPAMLRHVPDHVRAQRVLARVPGLPCRDESFDVAIASFVLSHIASPSDAVADIHRVLRYHGRLGVTSWGPSESGARDLWVELVGAHQTQNGESPLVARELPFEKALESSDLLAKVVAQEGFEIECKETKVYERRMSTNNYLGARQIMASSRSVQEEVGPARWRELMRRTRSVFDREFGSHLTVRFDAHFVVGVSVHK